MLDYRIFESAKDFAKWCICIANADQNLSYYVKHVLFKLRENPQPADRVLHGQIQKKIQEALEWGKKHLALPTPDLGTDRQNRTISCLAVGAVGRQDERHGGTTNIQCRLLILFLFK